MTKIETLRKIKEGIKFGKSITDIIKEKYSDLLDDTLELTYISEMVSEILAEKDTEFVYFDTYGNIKSMNNKEVGLRDLSYKTLKGIAIEDVELSFVDTYSSWKPVIRLKVKNLFKLTDAKAYSEYLVKKVKDEIEKHYASRLKDVTILEEKYQRLLELGLSINTSESVLEKIKYIETLRGTKLTKENVNEALEYFKDGYDDESVTSVF